MIRDQISLYFCAGNSDKEYHAAIEENDAQFLVSCSWGRRGNTLQTQSHSFPKYEAAKKFFDAKVAEKLRKGYSPGEAGTPYQHTENEQRSTGVLPQLLNPVEEEEAKRFIKNDAFWMQEKKDGKRVLIRKDSGGVTGINRKGLTIGLPSPVVAAANALPVLFIIDGEACGDVTFAFDLLEMNGVDLRGFSYSERLRQLENLLSHHRGAIQSVETAKDSAGKRKLFDRLQKEQREGVVFKDHDAPYFAGRPSSGGSQLKFKFYATASCIVAKVNAKRSVALELFDSGGAAIGVGNVTIPANQKIPAKSAILEVRYLYAYPKGALFQPTCLGIRDDIEPSVCTVAQLKFKPVDGEEDEEA